MEKEEAEIVRSLYDINESDLSPMMRQYKHLKDLHSDCIIFFRLGDFYEMFFEDAICASQILELTLTARDCGSNKRAPMCGVPFHACDSYIAKLINANHKVAIVEQVSDPKAAGNNLVERDAIRIVTPGTVVETECLTYDVNNYIVSIHASKTAIGLCWADISTGFMEVAQFSGENAVNMADNLLATLLPKEVICSAQGKGLESLLTSAKKGNLAEFTQVNEVYFNLNSAIKIIKEQFKVSSITAFDIADKQVATCAAGAILHYLAQTQKKTLSNINKLSVYFDKDFLQIDYNARKNLEVVENMVTHKKQGSLLGLLDATKTSMGARLVRFLIENPLSSSEKINARLDAVSELYHNIDIRENASDVLMRICDIERLTAKIATQTITPKDCFALGQSLKVLPELKRIISGVKSELLVGCLGGLDINEQITTTLVSAFDEHAPTNYRDGNFIQKGFNEKLDSLKNIRQTAYDWVTTFEQSEKQRTGIRNLKVSYNKVFGYYIEVSKGQLGLVPPEYQLRQTTLNGEKFITPELKEAERMILSGNADALELELKIFEAIKALLYENVETLMAISKSVATLDALISLAKVSAKNGYVRPEINDSIDKIEIIGGRHPVVEQMLGANQFIDNDTLLDSDEDNILIITGPNMGGKSTYMRQVALITLMAHIGCFVPARNAKIMLTDRIFTRIGASDELAFGNSTFMVEMSEVSNIIKNATARSLLILDEVGRGTSTFDGMSIAWAVIEYISKHIKAKTLFATHYHELVVLENRIVGVKNYRVLVRELDSSVVFLHKIARGSANRSFGIEVAALAGLPGELIDRAREICDASEMNTDRSEVKLNEGVKAPKLDPCAVEVINVLKEMDMNTISPLMAFGTLQNLVDKVHKK